MPFKESTKQRKMCWWWNKFNGTVWKKNKFLLKDEEEWHEMGQKDSRKAPAEYKLGDQDGAVTNGAEVLCPCAQMPSPTVRPASLSSLLSSQELTSQWNQGRAQRHFKQKQCSAEGLLKLGSVFTACQVFLGQTGLPDNPRDGFLNYRVLSAPAGLREGHAPSPALHPTQDGDGGAAVQARWIWARMRVWGTEPRACPTFRPNCCFNQYGSQTWMWHGGKICTRCARAGFEMKGIQVMMLS